MAASVSAESRATPSELDRSLGPIKTPPTPGTDRSSSMLRTASADSISSTTSRSPSGLSGQTSARRTYSAAATPQNHWATRAPTPRRPAGSGCGESGRCG